MDDKPAIRDSRLESLETANINFNWAFVFSWRRVGAWDGLNIKMFLIWWGTSIGWAGDPGTKLKEGRGQLRNYFQNSDTRDLGRGWKPEYNLSKRECRWRVKDLLWHHGIFVDDIEFVG